MNGFSPLHNPCYFRLPIPGDFKQFRRKNSIRIVLAGGLPLAVPCCMSFVKQASGTVKLKSTFLSDFFEDVSKISHSYLRKTQDLKLPQNTFQGAPEKTPNSGDFFRETPIATSNSTFSQLIMASLRSLILTKPPCQRCIFAPLSGFSGHAKVRVGIALGPASCWPLA